MSPSRSPPAPEPSSASEPKRAESRPNERERGRDKALARQPSDLGHEPRALSCKEKRSGLPLVIARARSTSQGANRCQTATPSPDRPPAEPCFPCGPPLAARARFLRFLPPFLHAGSGVRAEKAFPPTTRERGCAQQIIQLLMDSSNFGSELGRVAVFYTQSFIFSRVSSHFYDSSRLGKVTPNISKDGCDGFRPNQGDVTKE